MLETQQSAGEAKLATSSAILRSGNLTVTETVNLYMAAYGGRDTSRAHRLLYWSAYCGPARLIEVDGDIVFAGIKELQGRPGRFFAGLDADCNRIFRAKGKLLSAATCNRYLAALSALFSWAQHQRLLPRGWSNPCREVEQQPEHNSRVRFLSQDEEVRLLAACRQSHWPKLHTLVLLALTTGARKGELVNLRVRDLDLEHAAALVNFTKNRDRKTLALTPPVIAALRATLPSRPEALIFGSKRRPEVPYHFESVWKTALKAAQVKNFRFHDCRHHCASKMAQDGASLLEISDILGHRQLSVTRRYSE